MTRYATAMRTEKRCPHCRETKPIAEFIRPRAGTPSDYCHPCRQAKRRREYERSGGRDEPYRQVLKRDYGMTLADYNAILARQAHRCAICRRPEAVMQGDQRRRLSVDHDHVTGHVRGLLCSRCSRVVWAIEENHTTLDAIRTYLEDFRASLATP